MARTDRLDRREGAGSVTAAAAPDVSVVIATYDRPAMLADTLRSCVTQANPRGFAYEVVVVDNHPSGSAEPVVAAIQAETATPMRYARDLTRNMSELRNRCFAEARAPLVAFIDDDEVADPDWLDQLTVALKTSGAAIAVGPRLARFADGAAPAYDPSGSQFVRDLHLPDLTLIPLTRDDGKPRYGLGTGNSLFDMAACFAPDEAPMRTEFGDAGGEDAELFVRLNRQGHAIVWAAKARVTETVLPHRTKAAYRLLRTRRETQHYVTIYLDGARRPRLAWAVLMAKGLAQLCVGAILATALLEYRSETRLRGRLLMAHGLGKLSWRRPVGYIYEMNSGANTLA